MEELEIVRPGWRDGSAHVNQLGKDGIHESISSAVIDDRIKELDALNIWPTGAVREDSIQKMQREEKGHIKPVLGNLLFSDLRELSYWIWMSGLLLIFVLVEMATIILFGDFASDADGLRLCLFVLGMFAVIMPLGTYLVYGSAWYRSTFMGSPGLFKKLGIELFQVLPVILPGFLLIVAHVLALTNSDGRSSPFAAPLVALLCLLAAVPRDNSRLTFIITIIAGILGIGVLAKNGAEQDSRVWGGNDLGASLGCVAYIHGVLSVLVLRWRGTRRILV